MTPTFTFRLPQLAIGFGLCLTGQLAVAQAPVAPDATFGTNGSVLTGLTTTNVGSSPLSFGFSATAFGGPEWRVMSQAIVSNGAILVCGTKNYQFVLQRYRLDGTPDATFGLNGSVATAFPKLAAANGLAVQPDGKIVVVGGMAGDIGPVWAAARYTADGRLDPAFGTNGLAHPDPNNTGGPSELARVVVLANGNLLAAASYDHASPTRLFRLLPTGQPDVSFNNGSAFGPAITGMFQEMTTQPDGKVLLLTDGPGGSTPPGRVGRYTATGQPDPTFGTAGETLVQGYSILPGQASLPRPTYLHALAVQPDGKLVVAGHLNDAQVAGSFGDSPALFRLNADGTPDAPFNAAAARSLAFTGGLTAVGIQRDGRLVVGGSITRYPQYTGGLLLARYSAAGALDAGFGTTAPGVYAQNVGGSALVRGLTVLPATGQLLAWEAFRPANALAFDLRLTRYGSAVATATRPATALLGLAASPVPTTGPLRVRYTLPAAAAVSLTVHDQLGRPVAQLLNAAQPAGPQELAVDLRGLAAGSYFCSLRAGALRQVVRLVVL